MTIVYAAIALSIVLIIIWANRDIEAKLKEHEKIEELCDKFIYGEKMEIFEDTLDGAFALSLVMVYKEQNDDLRNYKNALHKWYGFWISRNNRVALSEVDLPMITIER